MSIHLPRPDAPKWDEINTILEPFYQDEELKIFFDQLKQDVRREWKEVSITWSVPLIALYNAYYGRLWRELHKLKESNGDIEEAKRLIFNTSN